MSPWASVDAASEQELLMDQDSELDVGAAPLDVDAEFGGREARLVLERKLLRKLDVRMSILVLIYILNYVRLFQQCIITFLLIFVHRLTGTMFRECVDVYCPATADKLLQRRSFGGFRGRSASERSTVQHTPKHTLYWLYLDADTFVSMTN
jgi:hypothetical protein